MRKKKRINRPLKPDKQFNSIKIAKFINYVMEHGKKTVARTVVYNALSKIKDNPLEIFEKALQNTAPKMELISRRIGGANYQIPIEVRPERKLTLAMRWILESARKKKGATMAQRLSQEFILAAKGEGDAVSKKINTHKMADANRAFAHFARSR